ncbi:MAG: tRNA uridine-5-carboxymethylaminomethyl(34) synthesis GTPase MnmE [Bacilli bacterium]|nr:tRNA uridine-5-carboxymethylaminomethyl(34) synthesis GTPase MnmE [Bacilli bacterium]
MNSINDTIVALCSGAIKSAISVIRVSGNDSFNIVNSIFSNKKEKLHQKAYYGFIKENDEIVDEVMVTYYVGPKSFTAEDMVEISCHGNMYIVSKIIELIISKGARLAENGEFTKRAFLFNRIDLVNAESINDLINANSKQAVKLAMSGLNGLTSEYVLKLSDNLLNVISQIEVNIDYPEYDDVEQLRYDSVLPSINEFINQLDKVIDDTKKGQTIKDGIDTVIVGRPNVGKSSLLNAMLKEDKAIVTNIAGTTRDIVEGKIDFYGLTLNLIDTAGIRKSDDVIENIGINKSLKSLEKAQLVLLVIDGSEALTKEDEELLEKTKDYKRIIVINKNDNDIKVNIENAVYISSLNKDLKQLEERIKEEFKDLSYNDEPLLFNARQLGLLNKAKESLLSAKNEAENGQVIDIIAIDLQAAYGCILEILGKRNKEDLLDNIFSKFCLGK